MADDLRQSLHHLTFRHPTATVQCLHDAIRTCWSTRDAPRPTSDIQDPRKFGYWRKGARAFPLPGRNRHYPARSIVNAQAHPCACPQQQNPTRRCCTAECIALSPVTTQNPIFLSFRVERVRWRRMHTSRGLWAGPCGRLRSSAQSCQPSRRATQSGRTAQMA